MWRTLISRIAIIGLPVFIRPQFLQTRCECWRQALEMEAKEFLQPRSNLPFEMKHPIINIARHYIHFLRSCVVGSLSFCNVRI